MAVLLRLEGGGVLRPRWACSFGCWSQQATVTRPFYRGNARKGLLLCCHTEGGERKRALKQKAGKTRRKKTGRETIDTTIYILLFCCCSMMRRTINKQTDRVHTYYCSNTQKDRAHTSVLKKAKNKHQHPSWFPTDAPYYITYYK